MPVGRVAEIVVRGVDRQRAGLDQGSHLLGHVGGRPRRQVPVLGLDDDNVSAGRLAFAGAEGKQHALGCLNIRRRAGLDQDIQQRRADRRRRPVDAMP